MKQYTYDTVVTDLEEIVIREGAETIADCAYVESDGSEGELRPVCIVGHFFWNHGLIEFDEWDRIDGKNSDGALEYLEKNKHITFDSKAKKLLMYVQALQDNGNSWGWSLETSIRDIEREES